MFVEKHDRNLPRLITDKTQSKNDKIIILVTFSIVIFVLTITCTLVICLPKRTSSTPTFSDKNETFDTVATSCNKDSSTFDVQSVLGCGTYSTVWLGKYKGDRAAVKTFMSSGISLWKNETNIYLQNCMEHENILQFRTAGEKECYEGHKLYLITDYCEFGSLKKYLTSHKLEWDEIIVLVSGLAAGVAYLHSDRSSKGSNRWPIAHQDIKSTNVLVSGKRKCVIADFGLAAPIVTTQKLCTTIVGQARI